MVLGKYRIAGKFGVELNLADISETAKFNSADCSTFVMKQWLILGFHQIKNTPNAENWQNAKFTCHMVACMD